MMEKKSANGFQTKAGEGGVQRKQLPYSVETPYGFHLDLDFLKYVDDIEKGNTIKRVHIQRRVKGPPKFSTLPRNFSLPGHGARPVTTEKDSTWSGTSTLGPKPRSRVTEVQQIFDFRANEGGTSTQRGTASQGSGYSVVKPRDEAALGARAVEERTVGLQSRPNLLRASSMPVTLQQRKGSDSSSPDRVVGTPENGSTENMFRASPDVTERRSVPQDRTGLHQQITVALKRVRELEEQVKTIPELKAQICSLREEREKLLLQLQIQTQALIDTSPSTTAPCSDSESRTQPAAHRPTEGLSLAPTIQPAGVAEKRLHHPSEKSAKQKGLESPVDHAARKLSRDIAGQELTPLQAAIKDTRSSSNQDVGKTRKPQEPDSLRVLQEKLMNLEDKLTQASQELDRTNGLLKDQLEENKSKEEKILQLSEGMRVEIVTTEAQSRPRRESIDAGTVTEKVDFANQETETEAVGTVDQGTDTEKICIKISVPTVTTENVDQEPETEVETHDQVTEIEPEASAASPPRPRANSMERGTVTERIATQDQTTETPAAERVNQVTETEGETETNHPYRPRASSADRGTETERVDTVDRVTETEAAQSSDQQTETETERRPDNNPPTGAEAESPIRDESVISERVEEVNVEVRESRDEKEENERLLKVSESVVMKVITESSIVVQESVKEQTPALDTVIKNEDSTSSTSSTTTMEGGKEPMVETVIALKDSETKAVPETKNEVTEVVETKQITVESEKTETAESEILCGTVKETVVTDVSTAEDTAVKTAAPVRPQRGRKPSTELVQPMLAQPQAAPVRPRRGSSEVQAKQPQTKPEPQAKVEDVPVIEVQAPTEQQVKPEPQAKVEEAPKIEVQDPTEKQIKPKPEAKVEGLPKIEVQAPTEQQVQPLLEAKVEDASKIEVQAPTEQQVKPEPEAKVEEAPKIEVQASTEQVKPEPEAKVEVAPKIEVQASTEQVKPEPEAKVEVAPKIEVQAPTEQVKPEPEAKVEVAPKTDVQAITEQQVKPEPKAKVEDASKIEVQPPTEKQVKAPSVSKVEARPQEKKPAKDSGQVKPPSKPQAETQGPSPGSSGVQTRPKSIQSHSQTTAVRRTSKELKGAHKGSQPPSRGLPEAHTRQTRQGSSDLQSQSQGLRRSSGETQASQKITSETKSLRRGSSETAQRRGSNEAQATPRDATEAQTLRRGSSESPTSPAALGQVVTRLTGLLGEQWAQLGSSSGAQQTASQQESPSTQKQTAGKRAEAGKGAAAKPAGKTVPAAATTGKPAGKPGPSKMSSIQSQLVSSLSVLSAFYSPAQKAAAAKKQQEQGLKSIMKKNGVAAKQGSKGAKKNLKFVGVNGGYETTSSEESSGDEKSKVEVEVEAAPEEEEDSSEPEVEKEKEKEPELAEKPEETAETQVKDAEGPADEEAGAAAAAAAAKEEESEGGLLDPESSQELQEQQAELEKVDRGFIDACVYVKDRMEEVSSPDKEMRQVLVVLYQEWFKVSSQKLSQADTVRLYLRQVGLTTPTMLPYVVNLTDGNGNMALHYSVSHSNFPVVKLLLDTGLCETDNVNKAGYTPVMLAALTAAESPDDLEVAQQLLQLGDVNARSRLAGQTALMLAVSHGRVAMVKLLLSAGADVNAQDREGSTALMCASEHGHTHITRLLLETGRCDTGLVDKNGQTALSVAQGSSHQEIIDLLKANATGQASKPQDSAGLL